MTTISDGTTTITPLLVQGYEAATSSRNVVHQILGRADDDVSLMPDSLRSGTLRLLFADAESAWAAHALHTQAAVLTLADSDVSQVGMRYVRQGEMTLALDPQTRIRWELSVGFKEVAS